MIIMYMSTLHILSNPHAAVNINRRDDPFSVLAVKFMKYMTQYGWNCVHYGVPGTEVDCELVPCLDKHTDNSGVDAKIYNDRAGAAIAACKQAGDMILCYHGWENKGACELNPDLRAVEHSIGYETKAVFAPFRAFTSQAQMHMFYGERGMLMSPSWFDTVIYNAISEDEFDYSEDKDDYFLYFGRVIPAKGIDIAIQATQSAGKKLIIAGRGDLRDLGYSTIPKHVTLAGLCDADQRRKLMSRAKAILGPTYYVEPFGNMVVEGYMSGTPAITTDWGGFTETVIQGVTGFRCREHRQFIEALERIDEINPRSCHVWATANCEDKVVHPQLDAWLRKVQQYDYYRK